MSAPLAAHFQLFAADERSEIRWRLLSGNNREIGRAVSGSADVESCLLAVKQFLAVLKQLSAKVRRHDDNAWHWTLSLADIEIARSGRPYDRQVRCEQAVRQFLDLAPRARCTDAVMLTGSRRWHHHTAGRQPMSFGPMPNSRRSSQRDPRPR